MRDEIEKYLIEKIKIDIIWHWNEQDELVLENKAWSYKFFMGLNEIRPIGFIVFVKDSIKIMFNE